LSDLNALQELTSRMNATSHYCVGADFSPETVNAGQIVDNALMQSTIITRADLADELSPLFSALASAQAQIVAVSCNMTTPQTAE
jgi:hypothetical protein